MQKKHFPIIKKAFTLIELVIVIAIIIMLAGIIVIAIKPQNIFINGRNSQRTNDLSAFNGAIARYLAESSIKGPVRSLSDFNGYTNLYSSATSGTPLGNCPNGVQGISGNISGAYDIDVVSGSNKIDFSNLINLGYLSKILKDPSTANPYQACIDNVNGNKLIIFSPDSESSTNKISLIIGNFPAVATVSNNTDTTIIQLNNTYNSTALTNYQVLINIDTASLISSGVMKNDCGDIRFYDSSNTISLPYWIETGCNTSNTQIWVKVNSIASSSWTTINMKYKQPSYTSESSIANTFIREITGVYAAYDFTELSGNIVYDKSGNGLHGTAYNAPIVDGQYQKARSFNGGTSYILLPSGFADFTNGFTVVSSIYPTTNANWSRLIDLGNGSCNENILIAREGSYNDSRFDIYKNDCNGQYMSASNVWQTNQWNNLLVTIDPSLQRYYYRNGSLVYNNGSAFLPSNVTRTSNFIGKSNWGGDSYYEGNIEGLYIFNKSLSASDASDLYNFYPYVTTSKPGSVLLRKLIKNPPIAITDGSGGVSQPVVTSNINLNQSSISGRSCADAVNYSVTNLSSNTATLNSVPAAGCLSNGDQVLLINLQGTASDSSNVGNYEELTVSSDVTTNTVTFTSNKTKLYGDSGTDNNIGTARTNQRVMLQRIPIYTSLVIASNGTLSANTWDGQKNGVLYFKVNGNIVNNGIISMQGKGYSGGSPAYHTVGQQGETYTGLGTNSLSANNGGGGGGSGAGGDSQTVGTGGGGSYVTAGTNGSSINGGTGGTAGNSYGIAGLTKMYLGSGGGAGGNSCFALATNGNGGAGGGILFFTANNLNNNGLITVAGNDGGTGWIGNCADAAAAGGGAGGSLYNNYSSASGTGIINISGGTGVLSGSNNFGQYSGKGGNGTKLK